MINAKMRTVALFIIGLSILTIRKAIRPILQEILAN